jgi:hypothetical protein
MWVFQRLVFSFLLVFGGFWAVFPGGFGLLNFRAAHPGLLGQLGRLCWWLLLLVHPLALCRIWSGDEMAPWFGSIAAMHVLFFAIFGRNVGTR